MSFVSRQIHVAAPRHRVWAAVAALDEVAAWNPNVATATCGPVSSGVGAMRRCELTPSGTIDEVVAVWDEPNELRFTIGRHGAIRRAQMGFELIAEDAGTTVIATSEYQLAFGPLGPVIDQLTVRRQMTTMLDRGLTGLKQHVETEATDDATDH